MQTLRKSFKLLTECVGRQENIQHIFSVCFPSKHPNNKKYKQMEFLWLFLHRKYKGIRSSAFHQKLLWELYSPFLRPIRFSAFHCVHVIQPRMSKTAFSKGVMALRHRTSATHFITGETSSVVPELAPMTGGLLLEIPVLLIQLHHPQLPHLIAQSWVCFVPGSSLFLLVEF